MTSRICDEDSDASPANHAIRSERRSRESSFGCRSPSECSAARKTVSGCVSGCRPRFTFDTTNELGKFV